MTPTSSPILVIAKATNFITPAPRPPSLPNDPNPGEGGPGALSVSVGSGLVEVRFSVRSPVISGAPLQYRCGGGGRNVTGKDGEQTSVYPALAVLTGK